MNDDEWDKLTPEEQTQLLAEQLRLHEQMYPLDDEEEDEQP